MRRTVLALVAFGLLTAFASPKADSLDAIAEAYVKLSLEAGVREDGYVDAYTGPGRMAGGGQGQSPHPGPAPD